MRRETKERIVAAFLLAAAVLLLLAGGMRTHQVYDESTEEYGLRSFTRISDAELVEDATFSGVERLDGRLYSTYDRSEPRGRRACPT